MNWPPEVEIKLLLPARLLTLRLRLADTMQMLSSIGSHSFMMIVNCIALAEDDHWQLYEA